MPPAVRAIAFDAATWRELGPRMLELERQEWGKRAFSPREMRWQATNRDAVVMTTWDGSNLVGFAVAGPAWAEGRASLLNVLIDPAYRGQGLVWPLIAGLERELFARGIRELDIDARVENGFADNVASLFLVEQIPECLQRRLVRDLARTFEPFYSELALC